MHMASPPRRPGIFVVAGVGNGTGTGAASARVFSKAGYRIALISRNGDHLKKTAEVINSSGGDAAPFPVQSYTYEELHTAFDAIKKHWPNEEIRVGLWNAGYTAFGTFLDITPEVIRTSLDTNVIGAFAFAREAILAYKDLQLNDAGKRGSLIFTGATAATRGTMMTSAFAAGKFGLRALSQSLNKEFGKQDIHVSHAIIDGGILSSKPGEKQIDAKGEKHESSGLRPESIAKAYLYLANQDSSAWTWELDLRPAHEKW